MSCDRENIIWQSRDGTWNRAFYDYYETNTDDPDRDYEWDVEYTDEFNWVVTGLASEDAAHEAWDGANPGGYSLYDTPSDVTDAFDAKAAAWLRDNPPRRERALIWPR
jgi:hypothetical protein